MNNIDSAIFYVKEVIKITDKDDYLSLSKDEQENMLYLAEISLILCNSIGDIAE